MLAKIVQMLAAAAPTSSQPPLPSRDGAPGTRLHFFPARVACYLMFSLLQELHPRQVQLQVTRFSESPFPYLHALVTYKISYRVLWCVVVAIVSASPTGTSSSTHRTRALTDNSPNPQNPATPPASAPAASKPFSLTYRGCCTKFATLCFSDAHRSTSTNRFCTSSR